MENDLEKVAKRFSEAARSLCVSAEVAGQAAVPIMQQTCNDLKDVKFPEIRMPKVSELKFKRPEHSHIYIGELADEL